MNTTTNAKHRILSLALALCLLLGMTLYLPGLVEVSAAIGMQGSESTITIYTTEIAFAGHEWVVIGYNGESGSVYSSGNTATLLLKDSDAGGGFDPVPFRAAQASPGVGMEYHSFSDYYYAVNPDDPQWTNPNEYRGSTLQQEMESIASGFPTMEQARINARTLTAGDDPYWPITGGDVGNQLLWPLSRSEWLTLDASVQPYNDSHSTYLWWLRSPYDPYVTYAFAGIASGYYSFDIVPSPWAVRPAFQLNLESVIFTSGASAKSVVDVGDGLVGASAPSGILKFTMGDNSIAKPALTFAGTTNGTDELRFGYTGATIGGNQYISCVLVSQSTNNVEYYGKLADCETEASGVFSIPLNGVADDTYKLKIFCEQANGDLYTDFVGASDDYTLVVNGSGGSVSGGSGATDNDPPQVSGVFPYGYSVSLGTSSLSVTFNEDIDTDIPTAGAVNINEGATLANEAWDDDRTITYQLDGLQYSTTYTVSISGFWDLSGNVMVPHTYEFTTADPPLPDQHTVTLIPDPTGGGSPEASAANAAENDVVTLTANPNEGWRFTRWSSSPAVAFAQDTAESTTFAMPDEDVIITAHYTEIEDENGGGDENGGSPGSSSNGSSRSSSSGGSSTPDSRVAKTQLPASAFSWDGRTLTIDYDNITPLGLLSVRWDDAALTRGTDYGVYQGSVIVRFSEAFMAAQKDGDHTVKVEFMNHTGEATVTVGDTGLTTDVWDDNDTHNPETGGYPDGYSPTDNPNTGDGRGIWTALLLGSLGAAALVKLRPRLRVKN